MFENKRRKIEPSKLRFSALKRYCYDNFDEDCQKIEEIQGVS